MLDMKKILTALSGVFLITAPAFALDLTGETTAGRRWIDTDDFGLQAHEFGVSSHLQIPKMPISVGLAGTIVNLKNDDLRTRVNHLDYDTGYGLEAGLELKAWIPPDVLKFPVIPYLRFNQVLFSSYEWKGSSEAGSVKGSGEVTGYHTNIGVSYALTSTLSLLGEYSTASKRLKMKNSYVVNDFANTRAKINEKYTFNSRALLLGLQMKV